MGMEAPRKERPCSTVSCAGGSAQNADLDHDENPPPGSRRCPAFRERFNNQQFTKEFGFFRYDAGGGLTGDAHAIGAADAGEGCGEHCAEDRENCSESHFGFLLELFGEIWGSKNNLLVNDVHVLGPDGERLKA